MNESAITASLSFNSGSVELRKPVTEPMDRRPFEVRVGYDCSLIVAALTPDQLTIYFDLSDVVEYLAIVQLGDLAARAHATIQRVLGFFEIEQQPRPAIQLMRPMYTTARQHYVLQRLQKLILSY